jgi:valyl-tRNA synthetase
VPFITDCAWKELYSRESIHTENFPKILGDKKLNKFTKKILDFNSKIWNEKKYLKISLKDEIKMGIPKELKLFEKDLRAMHNLT